MENDIVIFTANRREEKKDHLFSQAFLFHFVSGQDVFCGPATP
jgi:hypothetical protein